jgi:hypothetical protein
MKCPKCEAKNREVANFCNEFAAPIEASCPQRLRINSVQNSVTNVPR